jgi:hypothetical protein
MGVAQKDARTGIIVITHYSVAMRRMGMIQSRTGIPAQVARGKSYRRIARETHHCRDFIREIRHVLNSPSDPLILGHPLGALERLPES